MTEMPNAPVRQKLLLTVLGTNPQPTQYTLGNRKAESQLAPVALLDLLPEEARPDRVLALCTPEAKKDSWPLLEREMNGRYQVESIEVPGGDRQEDIHAFLAAVTVAIPEKADLIVDVTHGFRHFSFLTYIAVLYLAALRGVRVRGAYYGMLNRDGPSPFLDLRPLLELPRWVHALEVLRETGSALPMAENLRDGGSNGAANDIAERLSRLSEAHLSGLPLELGYEARELRCKYLKALKRLLRQHNLPLAEKLTEHLDEILQPMVLDGPASGKGWKKKIKLSENELARQVRVIDDLLRRRNFATAVGLMNEWTVSWVVHMRRGNGTKHWLDYGTERKAAASLLGAMAKICKDKELRCKLTVGQHCLGDFWRLLTELRNGFAHHGMRPQVLLGNKDLKAKFTKVENYWRNTLRILPTIDLSLDGSSNSRLLVSPIGLRPGVLFSAIHACRAEIGSDPNLVLVICSIEARGKIKEAIEHAEYSGPVEPLMLNDAFGGSKEIKQMTQDSRRRFIGATEVLVNVTGGTTLMGLAAEEMASQARSLACPVRRFGLIDRRPPREQENDPYQAGEPFWLDPKDSEEDGKADRN